MNEAASGTMPADSYRTDREKARRLARMKRVATALLIAMAALYVLAGYYEPERSWLGYVRAFAEAAMIGALADWFAVTALFRHPLGLPVPHTAIIPKRKDEIGQSLANFVEENFLTVEALAPRLADMDFAEGLGRWIARPGNAERITEDVAVFLRRMLVAVDNRALRELIRDNLREAVGELRVTPFVGQVLEILLLDDPNQTVLNALVRFARGQLDENRGRLRTSIAKRTPRWLPKFVDKRIYERIVTELEELLEGVVAHDDGITKARFREIVEQIVHALKHEDALIERGEILKQDLLSHPELQRYLAGMMADVNAYLSRQAAEPDSALRRRIAAALADLGHALAERPELKRELNAWLRDTLLYVVTRYSTPIGSIVSETVKGWDAKETSARVELQVGRDLQFIRINGTLVGGLVGLALYTTWQAFAA